MKHLILLIVILFISFPAFANFGDSFRIVKEKVVTQVDPEKPVCAPHGDTPFSEVRRADLDIEFRLNALDSPSGGDFSFRTDNYDIKINYNLTAGFYAYAWYGIRDAEKNQYDDSAYQPEWESQMFFAGVGIYIIPTLSGHIGAGNIWLKNENDKEPSLEVAIERGISLDVPFGQNKVILSYRIIDAKLKTEDDGGTITESQGDGSFSSLSISFSIPFMR